MTPRCSSPLAAKLAIFIDRSFFSDPGFHYVSSRLPGFSSSTCEEMAAQNLATGEPGREMPGIHDRKPKTAWRHGVPVRLLVLVEGNLHAGDSAHITHPRDQRFRRMAIAGSVRPKQYNTVRVAAIPFGKIP